MDEPDIPSTSSHPPRLELSVATLGQSSAFKRSFDQFGLNQDNEGGANASDSRGGAAGDRDGAGNGNKRARSSEVQSLATLDEGSTSTFVSDSTTVSPSSSATSSSSGSRPTPSSIAVDPSLSGASSYTSNSATSRPLRNHPSSYLRRGSALRYDTSSRDVPSRPLPTPPSTTITSTNGSFWSFLEGNSRDRLQEAAHRVGDTSSTNRNTGERQQLTNDHATTSSSLYLPSFSEHSNASQYTSVPSSSPSPSSASSASSADPDPLELLRAERNRISALQESAPQNSSRRDNILPRLPHSFSRIAPLAPQTTLSNTSLDTFHYHMDETNVHSALDRIRSFQRSGSSGSPTSTTRNLPSGSDDNLPPPHPDTAGETDRNEAGTRNDSTPPASSLWGEMPLSESPMPESQPPPPPPLPYGWPLPSQSRREPGRSNIWSPPVSSGAEEARRNERGYSNPVWGRDVYGNVPIRDPGPASSSSTPSASNQRDFRAWVIPNEADSPTERDLEDLEMEEVANQIQTSSPSSNPDFNSVVPPSRNDAASQRRPVRDPADPPWEFVGYGVRDTRSFSESLGGPTRSSGGDTRQRRLWRPSAESTTENERSPPAFRIQRLPRPHSSLSPADRSHDATPLPPWRPSPRSSYASRFSQLLSNMSSSPPNPTLPRSNERRQHPDVVVPHLSMEIPSTSRHAHFLPPIQSATTRDDRMDVDSSESDSDLEVTAATVMDQLFANARIAQRSAASTRNPREDARPWERRNYDDSVRPNSGRRRHPLAAYDITAVAEDRQTRNSRDSASPRMLRSPRRTLSPPALWFPPGAYNPSQSESESDQVSGLSERSVDQLRRHALLDEAARLHNNYPQPHHHPLAPRRSEPSRDEVFGPPNSDSLSPRHRSSANDLPPRIPTPVWVRSENTDEWFRESDPRPTEREYVTERPRLQDVSSSWRDWGFSSDFDAAIENLRTPSAVERSSTSAWLPPPSTSYPTAHETSTNTVGQYLNRFARTPSPPPGQRRLSPPPSDSTLRSSPGDSPRTRFLHERRAALLSQLSFSPSPPYTSTHHTEPYRSSSPPPDFINLHNRNEPTAPSDNRTRFIPRDRSRDLDDDAVVFRPPRYLPAPGNMPPAPRPPIRALSGNDGEYVWTGYTPPVSRHNSSGHPDNAPVLPPLNFGLGIIDDEEPEILSSTRNRHGPWGSSRNSPGPQQGRQPSLNQSPAQSRPRSPSRPRMRSRLSTATTADDFFRPDTNQERQPPMSPRSILRAPSGSEIPSPDEYTGRPESNGYIRRGPLVSDLGAACPSPLAAESILRRLVRAGHASNNSADRAPPSRRDPDQLSRDFETHDSDAFQREVVQERERLRRLRARMQSIAGRPTEDEPRTRLSGLFRSNSGAERNTQAGPNRRQSWSDMGRLLPLPSVTRYGARSPPPSPLTSDQTFAGGAPNRSLSPSPPSTARFRFRGRARRASALFRDSDDWGSLWPGRPFTFEDGPGMGDYLPDEELDMSYEGLLMLSARIGDAKPRGTPSEVVQSLPRGMYKDFKTPESETRCPICLEDYEATDDVLRIHGCSHFFHQDCLQQWLESARTCPVCRSKIKRPKLPSSKTPATDSRDNDSDSGAEPSGSRDRTTGGNRRSSGGRERGSGSRFSFPRFF